MATNGTSSVDPWSSMQLSSDGSDGDGKRGAAAQRPGVLEILGTKFFGTPTRLYCLIAFSRGLGPPTAPAGGRVSDYAWALLENQLDGR